MLLYGSELWGLKQSECMEKIHYYTCKRLIKVPLKTCNFGVLGECGRYPLYIETAKRVLKYWIKILHMQNDRYVKKCYNMMLHYDNFGCTNWVSNVKKILYENGFGYIWENQHVQNENVFLQRVEQGMRDQFVQKWRNTISESSKLRLYCQIKRNFSFEYYLDVLLLSKFRNAFASLRLSCHYLEIESGRYIGLNREQRLCKFCRNAMEDEYHFVFICKEYHELRNQYIPQKYVRQPNMHKFTMIMATAKDNLIQNLASYIYHAFKKRKEKLQSVGICCYSCMYCISYFVNMFAYLCYGSETEITNKLTYLLTYLQKVLLASENCTAEDFLCTVVYVFVFSVFCI